MIPVSSCVKNREVSGLEKEAKTLDNLVHFCGFFIHLFIIFSSFHLGCNNPCITAYGLPSLEDNSKYMAALSFVFKACNKGYVYSQLMSG